MALPEARLTTNRSVVTRSRTGVSSSGVCNHCTAATWHTCKRQNGMLSPTCTLVLNVFRSVDRHVRSIESCLRHKQKLRLLCWDMHRVQVTVMLAVYLFSDKALSNIISNWDSSRVATSSKGLAELYIVSCYIKLGHVRQHKRTSIRALGYAPGIFERPRFIQRCKGPSRKPLLHGGRSRRSRKRRVVTYVLAQ